MSPRELLAEAERLDAAAFAVVARLDVPELDVAMARLSRAADYSKLWIASGALLMLFRGDRGRDAAADGVAAIVVTATIVNVAMKPLSRRPRPERDVLLRRHVRMPVSLSFPSGHAASAFAFATAVGRLEPRAGRALTALATAVAYSRGHTGVHFPGDVVAGAAVGAVCARLTGRYRPNRP